MRTSARFSRGAGNDAVRSRLASGLCFGWSCVEQPTAHQNSHESAHSVSHCCKRGRPSIVREFGRGNVARSWVRRALLREAKRWPRARRPVQKFVTFPTKRDQVGLGVVTKGTAPSPLVDIEIFRASALLTAPTIPLQDFFA